MTPEDVIKLLGLERGTCGYAAKSFESSVAVSPGSRASRPIGAALHFLVTVDAPVLLHRIASDQIYHHYQGDPLEVLLLYGSGEGEVAIVGPDLERGQRPQLLIPAGTFHSGRIVAQGTTALLGTTSWPAVADGEFEYGDPITLQAAYPQLAEIIASFPAQDTYQPSSVDRRRKSGI